MHVRTSYDLPPNSDYLISSKGDRLWHVGKQRFLRMTVASDGCMLML